MSYQSSIVCKYGDPSNVKRDSETLAEILNRQGSELLIDVIAECTGIVANKFNLTETERTSIRNTLVEQFEESLKEKL